MLRKLCKLALLPALLALATAPETVLAQGQPAGALGTTAPAVAPEAAVWAAAARYVYQDDPELQALLPKLLPTTTAATIEGFKLGLNKAVKLENKKPKDSHVFMFQTQVFQKVQQLAPANAPALAAAIEQELLAKHPERQNEPAFQRFSADIDRLAESASAAPTAAAATPDESAGNPMDQVGVAPAATAAPLAAATASLGPTTAPPAGQWLWLSLALSALSLASVAILWNKLSNTRNDLERIKGNWENSSSRNAAGKSFSQTDLAKAVEREVSRQLEQRVAAKPTRPTVAPVAAVMPTAPLAEVPAPPLPEPAAPPAPAPRLRTQYVGEAPFNNSFPARALSDQPGTYSMFAIESSEEMPEQGTFAVTGNLASHVRDHRSVLEPVCEYVGGYPLGSETRVIMEQPGVVRRRGDDWEVTQRARVRFE
jgi:hypothetical protein